MEEMTRPDEIYIRPNKAYQKLKMAYQSFQPVYISGATGFGKTSLIKNFLKKKKYLYLSAVSTSELKIETDYKIIVIDDISFLTELSEKNKIIKLCSNKNIWLVLIGRGNVPLWLIEKYIKNMFVFIGEEDLAFDENLIEKYFSLCGLHVDRDTLRVLQKYIQGHPIITKIFALCSDKTVVFDEKVSFETEKMFLSYLEQTVYEHWDRKLVNFFILISVVDEFTIPLAEMITAEKDVYVLLERAIELGSFLTEERGVYRIRPIMLKGLRKMLEREYTKEQRKELYYNAGLYFEINGKITDALLMYEKCENNNRISGILIKNAEKNPGSGNYYELKKYYFALPNEYIKKEPKLIAGMSMLYSMLMQPDESEKWYTILKDFEKYEKGNRKKEAKSLLVYLDIGLPHRGIKNVVEIFKNMSTLFLKGDIELPEFSVTSNIPSLMNGGKDFCDWSIKDKHIAMVIGKTIEKALRGFGVGLVNIALSESLFEKGADLFEVITYLNNGKMQSEARGKLEICFVAVGIAVKINLLQGDINTAIELIIDFRERVYQEKAERLLPNLEALLCKIALYKGDINTVENWLLSAPKENVEFFTMERFRYIVKIRVYLVQGNLSKALSLIQRMLYYAKYYERKYIQIEVRLLLAICYYRMKNKEWKNELIAALKQAESYHFTRVVSMEGIALWELIQKLDTDNINTDYIETVKKETREMSLIYPAYLKQQASINMRFSDNALRILRLQSEGFSYVEIAEKLGIKKDTVRYHSKETYKKLGVSGKAEAIAEAIRLKLI